VRSTRVPDLQLLLEPVDAGVQTREPKRCDVRLIDGIRKMIRHFRNTRRAGVYEQNGSDGSGAAGGVTVTGLECPVLAGPARSVLHTSGIRRFAMDLRMINQELFTEGVGAIVMEELRWPGR